MTENLSLYKTNPNEIPSPFLAEIRLFQRAYDNSDYIDRARDIEQASRYCYWNHLTAMLEAVSQGSVSITHQDYIQNEGFYAFGLPIHSMLKKGVEEMKNRLKDEPGYAIEMSRRQLELQEEELLERLAHEGQLNNTLMLSVSPYPDEMNAPIAKKLGYDAAARGGKIRIQSLNPDGSKDTVEIFFTGSSLGKINEIARALGKETHFNSIRTPSEALGMPIFLDKKHFPDYLTVLEEIGPTLYKNKLTGKERVAKSRAVMRQAEPLINQLVDLDEQLAISLGDSVPTRFTKDAINSCLTNWYGGLLNLTDEDVSALYRGLNSFQESTATVLKKIALINSYIQVRDIVEGWHVGMLSLFENEEAIFEAMSMGGAGISYCGVSIDSSFGAYGWQPETVGGAIFGYEDDAKRITRCPNCKEKSIVTAKEHGRKGIRCRCGNQVEGGRGALCIVEASQKASILDTLLVEEAETVD